MNRNYKVIWNRSLGCFTAVAEYAKSRGKSSKSSVSSNATINTTSNLSSTRIFRTTTIWLGLITAGFSIQAIAAPCNGSISVECGTNATADPLHGIAIGKNATAQGSQTIAIGGGSNGQKTTASGEQSIAIGANVVSSGNSSIAIGGDDLDDASKNGVNDIFKGYTGSNLVENTAAPYDGYTQSSGAASVAIGVKAQSEGALSTAVGVRSSSAGDASSAFGMGSSASKTGSVALGAGSLANRAGAGGGFVTYTGGATGNALIRINQTIGRADLGAVSVGPGGINGTRQIINVAAGSADTDAVNVAQLDALTMAVAAAETHYYSVNDNGTAQANYNNDGATGVNSIAAGIAAKAAGTFATAIGTDANAQGYASTALGLGAQATGVNSTALGREANAAANYSTALGWKASASADNSMALGREAKATGANNIALGREANTAGRNSMALGWEASASANNSMALGPQAKANAAKSIALGEGANATHESSIALGSGSVANGITLTTAAFQPLDTNGIPIAVAAPTAKSEVSIGSVGKERRITNLAAGAMDTDAVNVSQLRSLSDTVISNKTKYYSVKSTAAGNANNDGATGINAMAMGGNATAAGSQAIAIGTGDSGQNTTASGEQSIAIGANVVSSGNSSIAIGGDDLDDASKNGVNDIFKGYTGSNLVENTAAPYDGYTQSSGAASVAIGVKAQSEGALSTAVGVRSSSAGDASSAFGMGSSASKTGSVALGAGSTTLTDATEETTMSVGGKSYDIAGQAANAGAQVSVGSAGKERQIKHVAAGAVNKDSTDAINGSQLFATNQSIEDLSSLLSDIDNGTSVLAEQMDAGLNFGADSGALINKKMGSAPLTFEGGNNITTTAEGSGIKFDLNSEISLDKVTTGNTSMSNSGVTIIGGPNQSVILNNEGLNNGGNKITNVADGMAPRDAVNFGQLDAVSRNLGNSINELGYRIGEVEDDANAGISAAMAMSSLPQAYIIGKSMIGGGIATYNGESSVAIGFSKLSDDGRWVMKLNGTADTQGNVGAAIGAGFHFD